MGKSKKITEKVKQFYRGSAYKPNTKVASQDDMQTIISSLKKCLPLRGKTFTTNWRGEQQLRLRFVVGLSASLRALKQRKTKALIYDETTANHLAKYLDEFARLQRLPIIQARGLEAKEFNLTSLLVVSIVVAADAPSELIDEALKSDEFDALCKLLIESATFGKPEESIEFELPVLEKVPSSGKSREKKQARRAAAAVAASQQTHVGRSKQVQKMDKKVIHQGKEGKKQKKNK